MKRGIAVGLWMVALGACQVAALPQVVEERREVSTSELFDRGALTVMTRDLSPGTGLERVLEAPGAAELPARAAEVLGALRQEDVSARARALADEIRSARPHLIGLQGVAQVRRQSPGDAVFGGTRAAEAVTLDVLPVLLGELRARGLPYREVARVRNADVEVPVLTSAGPTFDDVRLTDFDIILARADVAVDEVRTGNYAARREVPGVVGLGPVALPRGWASVAAMVEGRKYRFVSTHLEPAPDEDGLHVQLAQTRELIGSLRGEPLPVVLVGDFNTPANLGLMGAPTYRELLLAGYVDVWTRRLGSALPAGGDVWPELPTLVERRNLVLVRNPVTAGPRRVGPVLAYGVGGTREAPRFEPGQSDLAGVVARLRMPASARN
jgi:hypothetical protein